MDRPSIEIFRPPPAASRWQTLVRQPSRMALRIYLIGLTQFVVVAAVIEVDHRAHEAERKAQIAEARRQSPPPWEAHGRYAAENLGRVLGDPAERQAELVRIATTFQWSVRLRDAAGNLLGEATAPGIEPRGPKQLVAVPVKDGASAVLEYVTAARWQRGDPGAGEHPPHPQGDAPGVGPGSEPRGPGAGPGGGPRASGPVIPPPGGPPIGLAAIAVLVVVGISSWLTARSFAKPLVTLARATRRFGKGELDTRVRMDDRADEIGVVARTFDDMADRIAGLLTAERELLANISHELRTPLARIRVALDLASEADPKVAMESFTDIAQDLAELERIVDDVLASARLALGADGPKSVGTPGLPVRTEEIDTRGLLDRAVARFRARNPARNLAITLPSSLPTVAGDAVLLRRVVDNLLDNAHKYTESAEGKVSLLARAEGAEVVIVVEDEGIGIAPDDLARLFEPFFRADRSRTRATGGLGLGLTLARRVVDAHHGTLTITSTLGKGTVATVRLPVRAG